MFRESLTLINRRPTVVAPSLPLSTARFLWLPVALSALGCVIHTGHLVTSVQLLPSTVPIAPGSYEIGPWVSAEGCDYVNAEFQVADLIFEAQGSYDALVNVTIEQIQRIHYTTSRKGSIYDVYPGNAYCYRIHGQAIRLHERPSAVE
jgi:hypothetical protein